MINIFSITLAAVPAHQKSLFPLATWSRLLRWRLQSRESCPSTILRESRQRVLQPGVHLANLSVDKKTAGRSPDLRNRVGATLTPSTLTGNNRLLPWPTLAVQ